MERRSNIAKAVKTAIRVRGDCMLRGLYGVRGKRWFDVKVRSDAFGRFAWYGLSRVVREEEEEQERKSWESRLPSGMGPSCVNATAICSELIRYNGWPLLEGIGELPDQCSASRKDAIWKDSLGLSVW
jgi:hypothetical protein